MTLRTCLLICVTALTAVPSAARDTTPTDASPATVERTVDSVIDGFHAAAAAGDKDRYLGAMTESGVFLGTDEWERWPRQPDFEAYVGERFKEGGGWSYTPEERTVAFSANGRVAWFDEVVVHERYGRFRGTGVLTRGVNGWKIAHYALSFLVPNEHWDQVTELIQTAPPATAAASAKAPVVEP
ncbi:MAG: nuclear transport factor 2 family protein [Pseudomonadota bacterium]